MQKDLAIVLNHGSVNSAVVTALAAQKHRVVLLHAEESATRASSRARGAYDLQAAHFKPHREHVLTIPALEPLPPGRGGDGAGVAVGEAKPQSALGAKLVDLLPLVSAAARYAAHYGASAVYLGLRVGGRGTSWPGRRSTCRSGTNCSNSPAACRTWKSRRRYWNWSRGR